MGPAGPKLSFAPTAQPHVRANRSVVVPVPALSAANILALSPSHIAIASPRPTWAMRLLASLLPLLAYHRFRVQFGLNQVHNNCPPPEPGTGLSVQFRRYAEPWTGLRSSSQKFGSEPWFRTGLRHHYSCASTFLSLRALQVVPQTSLYPHRLLALFPKALQVVALIIDLYRAFTHL